MNSLKIIKLTKFIIIKMKFILILFLIIFVKNHQLKQKSHSLFLDDMLDEIDDSEFEKSKKQDL